MDGAEVEIQLLRRSLRYEGGAPTEVVAGGPESRGDDRYIKRGGDVDGDGVAMETTTYTMETDPPSLFKCHKLVALIKAGFQESFLLGETK